MYTHLYHSLEFHLQSAPKIFNAVADVIEWMLKAKGVTYLAHDLNDFILLDKWAHQNARGICNWYLRNVQH